MVKLFTPDNGDYEINKQIWNENEFSVCDTFKT